MATDPHVMKCKDTHFSFFASKKRVFGSFFLELLTLRACVSFAAHVEVGLLGDDGDAQPFGLLLLLGAHLVAGNHE